MLHIDREKELGGGGGGGGGGKERGKGMGLIWFNQREQSGLGICLFGWLVGRFLNVLVWIKEEGERNTWRMEVEDHILH